jgi:hypothetical protein
MSTIEFPPSNLEKGTPLSNRKTSRRLEPVCTIHHNNPMLGKCRCDRDHYLD